ncbi:MAG: hypothetical protein JAZ17_02675 [Candidatus Thiodiazotropha endolucinida]|nr:hypothetical protein [Candidatus Thiodiazotropha endolucinida]
MSQIGLFSGLSGWLYDRLVNYSANRSYQPSVVLVKLPESSAPVPSNGVRYWMH